MPGIKDEQYKCSLSPATLEKARRELSEDPDTRLLEVKNLRKRLEKVPGLRARTDIQFLLAFLRARKFDQERTFALIKNHYQTRKDTERFCDLKPSVVKHIVDEGHIEVLPDRNKEGCRVVVIRVGSYEPDRYPIMDAMRAMYLTLMDISKDEETQVHGVQFIIDFANTVWKHYTAFTPSVAKICFSIIQDVVPLRMRRLDYVHEPSFFDTFFAVIKPIMNTKMVSRLHLHGNKVEGLHDAIPPHQLPTDIGGKQPPNNDKERVENFLSSDSLFEEDNKYGYVNMALNSEQTTSRSGDAGIEGLGGTFRKLDI
ncbi:alpha-tocopherol transfer protein-like [Aplysia californica]|uniref:Alpha-tocopherol transfer protein-like n=1 Tax=Aplysia californica TaxID=6500 RepID=A0ABM1A9F1_APLCA|nr:alpha-tocopherol transfer protein-like [Aplysia californica]